MTGALLVAVLGVGGSLVVTLRAWDVPFRGEHWALASILERDTGLGGKLFDVAHFVCFGHERFQPFAFVVPAVQYLVFGHDYVAHYVASWSLHVLSALTLGIGIRKLGGDRRASLYAIGLFASSYVVVDTWLWLFFVYILLTTVVGLVAVSAVCSGLQSVHQPPQPRRVVVGLVAGFAATLVYEPFIVIPTLLAAILIPTSIRHHRYGAAVLALGVSAALAVPQVIAVSQNPFVRLSFRATYRAVLSTISFPWALAWNAVGIPRTTDIAERIPMLTISVRTGAPGMLEQSLITAVAGALILAAIRGRWWAAAWRLWAIADWRVYAVTVAVGFAAFISAGRSGTNSWAYAPAQFRYFHFAYAVLLLVLGASLFRDNEHQRLRPRQRWVTPLIVAAVVGGNLWNVSAHARAVAGTFEPLTSYVGHVQATQPEVGRRTTTNMVVDAILSRSIGVGSEHQRRAVYNASGCIRAFANAPPQAPRGDAQRRSP